MAKKNMLQTLVSEATKKTAKKTTKKTAEKEQKNQAAADIPNIYALGKSEDGYIIVKDAHMYEGNPAYKKAIRKLHKMRLEATVENAAKAEQILAEAGMIRRTRLQKQNEGRRPAPPKFTPQVFENVPTGPDGAPETWVQMRPNAKPVGNFILIVAEIEVDEVKEVKTKSGKTKMKPTGNKIKQNSYRLYYCMDSTEAGVYLRDVHTGESLNLLPEEIKKGVVYAPEYDAQGNETNEVDRDNVVARLYLVQPQKISPAANA